MNTLGTKNKTKLAERAAEVNDIVEQTFYFEQKVFEWSKKVEHNKNLISKAIGRSNKLQVTIDEDLKFIAERRTEPKIEFFKEQLANSLSKSNYKKATSKIITIHDLSGLVKMLKEYGVPQKDFKRFIKSDTRINEAAISNLIELGEIELEDLQGCYKAEQNESIHVKRIISKAKS